MPYDAGQCRTDSRKTPANFRDEISSNPHPDCAIDGRPRIAHLQVQIGGRDLLCSGNADKAAPQVAFKQTPRCGACVLKGDRERGDTGVASGAAGLFAEKTVSPSTCRLDVTTDVAVQCASHKLLEIFPADVHQRAVISGLEINVRFLH